MKFAIIGAGNMGISVAGAILDNNLNCKIIDLDTNKLHVINQGQSPVPEDGANEIFTKALVEKRLETANKIDGSEDVIFIGVQTPSKGLICDYSALKTVLQIISDKARFNATIICASTVFPGAIKEICLPNLRKDLFFVYHPVFLRAGFGIADYKAPPKLIFGVKDPNDIINKEKLNFYTQLTDVKPQYIHWHDAEFAKVVHNAFMSTKISFCNEIGALAETYGCNPNKVIDIALNEDPRNGRLLTKSHTIPGIPFSGPCLPKDSDILVGMLNEKNIWAKNAGVCSGTRSSNMSYRNHLINQWISGNSPYGIIGLSFRPGFNELRHSLALDFIKVVKAKNQKWKGYDPSFVNIKKEDYLLACRLDTELPIYFKHIRYNIDEVFKTCKTIFINRKLNIQEKNKINDLKRLPSKIIDIYNNF